MNVDTYYLPKKKLNPYIKHFWSRDMNTKEYSA